MIFIRPKRRRGVILLLGLVLMAAIVASTIAIAVSISGSTHQSKNLDDYVDASLAADSGLERSLSIVKYGRSVSTIADITKFSGFTNQTVVSGGSSTMAVSSAPLNNTITIPFLRPFDSVTFDYSRYTAAGQLTPINANTTLSLVADGVDCPTTPVNLQPCKGQLEVDWVAADNTFSGRTKPSELSAGADLAIDSNTGKLKVNPIHLTDATYIQDENGNQPTSAQINNVKGFRITVRALDPYPHNPALTTAQIIDQATVKSIQITPPPPADCSGTPCPTGVIQLTSTGTAGTSQSVKQTSVLWQLAPSQFFSFVLFTEGNICLPGDAC